MARIVDLRSDTVTRPGPDMRRAIANAVVGDDVFGDDPTVKELEEKAASLFGTGAALFVPSGTMGNQAALASITNPGDEVILDRNSHIFNYEVAAASVLSGLQFNPLDGEAGIITAEQVEPHIRPLNVHQPVSSVIAVENTHNRAGGGVFPLDELRRIRNLARARGMKVHLDGARLANAVVASGVSFKDYVACVDTVNMCFSKGLGAPVGSIIGGSADTIERARKKRKQFGGGMRQAGILAAAAIFALDHHIDRLDIDHANAQKLGDIVTATNGLDLVFPVQTNIVIFRIDEKHGSSDTFLTHLEQHGILALPFGPSIVRMVTHLDVQTDDIDRVAQAFGNIAAA